MAVVTNGSRVVDSGSSGPNKRTHGTTTAVMTKNMMIPMIIHLVSFPQHMHAAQHTKHIFNIYKLKRDFRICSVRYTELMSILR